jgi:hypothetical protein
LGLKEQVDLLAGDGRLPERQREFLSATLVEILAIRKLVGRSVVIYYDVSEGRIDIFTVR